MDTASFSRAVLTKLIQKQVLEIAQDHKKKSVLIIDEASILRLKVLAECTSSLNFREAPSQSCPSSWPARTISPTSSYTKPPCPWPPGS
ncbi:hypothetical protein DFAR_1760005 [Desulfarculales bacterium]